MSETEKTRTFELNIPPLRNISTQNKKKPNRKGRKARNKTKVASAPSNVGNVGNVVYSGAPQKAINTGTSRTVKKVIFRPENNQVFEIPCNQIQSLDDVNLNFSLEPSGEFTIEDVPDIDIASLFDNE
jgi:hypothetical protein